MLDPKVCQKPLQKGQVVLLSGSGIRSSASGQKGVLLERNPATGRYRARLCAQPWRCVKVSRGAIHPVDTSQGTGAEGYSQQGAESCFGDPPAKCDYSLGAFVKANRHDLPADLKDVRSNWPLSPVRRGQVQDDRPLPRIQQGELYESIKKLAPHAPEDRCEVHRRRCYMYTSVKDSELMDFAGLPVRRAPVQRGRPLRLLPHVNSQDLKAMVEEDHGAEINRKMEQARYISSSFPPECSFTIDHLREEEMDERLGRMQQRAEKVKRERAERIAAAKAALEARQKEKQKELPELRGLREAQTVIELPEESEEQRILREFTEYEMESPTHGPSMHNTGIEWYPATHPDPSTPKKDVFCLDGYLGDEALEGNPDGYLGDEGFEEDKYKAWDEDFEAEPNSAERPVLIADEASLVMGELTNVDASDAAEQPFTAVNPSDAGEQPWLEAKEASLVVGELDVAESAIGEAATMAFSPEEVDVLLPVAPSEVLPAAPSEAYVPPPPPALADSASDIDELD